MKVHFIYKRFNQTFKTFKFDTVQDGIEFMEENNLMGRVVDVIIW